MNSPLSSPPAARASARAGFTLIELVVVLLILAILACMVVFMLTPTNIKFAGAGKEKTTARLTTDTTMLTIRDAILGAENRPGLWDDIGQEPDGFPHPNYAWLFRQPDEWATDSRFFRISTYVTWNPKTKRGWRGPYLQPTGAHFQVDPDRGFLGGAYCNPNYPGDSEHPVQLDGWGNCILLQCPSTVDQTLQRINARLVSAGPDGIVQTPLTKMTPDDLTAADVGDDVVLFLFLPFHEFGASP